MPSPPVGSASNIAAFGVPLVDLGGTETDATRRRLAAAAIDAAASEVGFFQVVGHGIPKATIAELRVALDAFFSLPFEDKLELRPPRPSVNRGYAPPRSESLAYSLGVASPPDLFEAFNVGPDAAPDDAVHAAAHETAFAPNRWPSLPGFRSAVVAYFAAAERLAHRMTALFALALGLEEGYFEPFTDHSTDLLRANHYHLAEGDHPVDAQLGMGPHTDYGIVTVLLADRVPGLELLGTDGAWHGVVPEEGALLVNLGDLLAQWTNDRWRSTLHRVQPPVRDASGRAERRSVAFFHDGNYDAMVACLPTCASVANPPRYEPVLAGEHLRAKLLGPRTMTPSAAVSTLSGRDPLATGAS